MEISTYTFPISDEASRKNLPDWVTKIYSKGDSYGWMRQYNFSPNSLDTINNMTEQIFGERFFTGLIPSYKQNSNLKDAIRLMEEQHMYFHAHELFKDRKDGVGLDTCNIWLIISTINKYPYGGVFAFQNKNNPNDLLIQGISKFPIIYIFGLLRPDVATLLPKLNSLLIPVVETLARNVRAKRIIVNPYPNQASILEKHYGFTKIDKQNFNHPCSITDLGGAYGGKYEKIIDAPKQEVKDNSEE